MARGSKSSCRLDDVGGKLATVNAGRRALVVDDEPVVMRSLMRLLEGVGFAVDGARSVREGIEALSRGEHAIAVIDEYLPDGSGQAILRHARDRLHAAPAVIMMTGNSSVGRAVSAMRAGASDYLEKPLGGPILLQAVERALQAAPLAKAEPRPTLPGAEAANPSMRAVFALADRVAATPNSSALLVGESGVGKEVIATRIHERSGRAQGPFIRVNVAAIPEGMMEAELFGSVKGAFTDAKRDRVGFIGSADGGTLLLDEIGELRIEHQAKLLRVLEDRSFFPIGSDRTRAVDVRVIAATNRDPTQIVESGRLRLDLFYRLGTVIRIPPLRERSDQIDELADHFVERFCAEFARPKATLSPAARNDLHRHAWPGNVRELRNVIERAVMLTDGDEIGPEAFDLHPTSSPRLPAAEPVPSGRLERARQALEAADRDRIVRALELADNSKVRAARALGISRSTLYEKLRRYKLE